MPDTLSIEATVTEWQLVQQALEYALETGELEANEVVAVTGLLTMLKTELPAE